MKIKKGEATISIDMDDEGVQKKIRIQSSEDGDEEELNFNWKGDEMPEEIKKRLAEKGYDIEEGDGHVMISKGANGTMKTNPNKAFLGVIMHIEKTVENEDGIETEKIEDAAIINDVVEGSAAEEAGLQKGDIITKIDMGNIKNADDITRILGNYKPGDRPAIAYTRDGKSMTTVATLKSSDDFKNAILNDFESEDIEIIIDTDEEGNKVKKKVIIIEKNGKKEKRVIKEKMPKEKKKEKH